MDVKIKFLGAARSVTGSKYLLEIDSQQILLDCGLFQGQKELRLRNWDRLPIDTASNELVVIAHTLRDYIACFSRLMKRTNHKR
jgi:metallo-beta-lactamase family protein